MGAPFINDFDTANPQGSNAANALDAYIRTDTKQALVERLGLEHYPLDGSTINGSTGSNDDTNETGQGRHIAGKVGVLKYCTTAQKNALVGSGVGSIVYDYEEGNFYYINSGGSWNILAINSDTIFADELSLTYDGNTLKMLRTKHQWTTTFVLTDAANIATDCSNSNSFAVTLGGNRVLDNPTNPQTGATYVWIITQDIVGSRTLSFGSDFKWSAGIAPILSTPVGSIDVITTIYDGTHYLSSILYDFQ